MVTEWPSKGKGDVTWHAVLLSFSTVEKFIVITWQMIHFSKSQFTPLDFYSCLFYAITKVEEMIGAHALYSLELEKRVLSNI